MKKTFLIAILVSISAITAAAQEPAELTRTKHEKAEQKSQSEQLIKDAIIQVGLNAGDSAQVEDAMKEAAKASTELKKDTSLSLDAKAEKKEEIDSAKNAKLKRIMGAEKYRHWNAIRKQQKEQTLSTFDPSL